MTTARSRQETGHPKPVLRDNPEGRGGERGGRGFRMGETHVYLMVDDCYLSHTIYGITVMDTHLD